MFSPPKATTRIKVAELSFQALKAAFADPEARIRINDLVPNSIPRVIGVSIGGGFLDDAAIHFSDNLSVLFGGRGTGKSTAVRAVAFALGKDLYDPAQAPFQSVSLFCEDAGGVQYRFDRAAGGDIVGRIRTSTEDKSVVTHEAFPVEYYGQGELGEVAQSSLQDSSALQSFLDRHIAFDGALERQSNLVDDLREIANVLAPLIEKQR